jgi:LuxR family maltose regulon positive regulatory protein
MGSMFSDILETKLLMPRIRSHLVRRDRLIARLDAGMHCWLTLLSAPAGYGKTTLLVDWLRAGISESEPPRAAAWLALDEGDNDPIQFVRLLVAALRPLVPEIDDAPLAMTQGPQPLPLRTVLAVLINELVASPREIILVLEDYHVIRQPAIHEAIAFLLEHLPPFLHLVIATREDPPFPLAKLRARGALCELRAADLRFTPDETTTFLREVMALPVTAAEAAVLEARTEGWIAGLQLAALSMSAGDDRSGSIAALGGSHRYFLEYLVAEVLARQPRPVQIFLLRTSVLNRLSAPLCDVVLGGEPLDGGAEAILEQIERANLFLVPLDAERRWYRYHQLFAELLQARLFRAEPGLAPDLHRRASTWYEEHGLIQEAIQHALAAPDWSRAARLIEQHGMAVFHLGQLQTILGWFQTLPAELGEWRSLLCIIHAFALGVTNQGEAAERYLQVAERHLHSDLPPDEAQALRARIDSLRAVMAGVRGDLTRSVTLAVQAEDLLPESDVTGRVPARIYAHRVMGDVRSASEHVLAAVAEQAKAAGLLIATRVALGELARLYVLQGRLRRAAATFIEAKRTLGPHVLTGLPKCCFGLGDLLRERNELDEAGRALKQGVESLTEANIVEAYVAANGYIALARLRQAWGDSRGAMAALGEFTDLARRREFTHPVTARAAAARAHLWMMQGNLVAAAHWADTSGLSPDDQVNHLREFEHLVFARVLIAKKRRTALALLDRLLQESEGQGRAGSAIEILALRALAFHALGDSVRALQDLQHALALGEPEEYVRVFVDEGAPMATLLRRAHTRGMAPEYAARLLDAFGDRAANSGPAPQGSTIGAPPRPKAPSGLVEPFTKREREVLRHLMVEASNQEIARRLFITTGTVKKHVYHIFGKLGVKNRTQAVAKAKALNLD